VCEAIDGESKKGQTTIHYRKKRGVRVGLSGRVGEAWKTKGSSESLFSEGHGHNRIHKRSAQEHQSWEKSNDIP